MNQFLFDFTTGPDLPNKKQGGREFGQSSRLAKDEINSTVPTTLSGKVEVIVLVRKLK